MPPTEAAFEPADITFRSQRLVLAGEPIDAIDPEGIWSFVLWAAAQGHTELVGFLLDHGADIEDRWMEGESPLMLAARYGHPDTVRLLERGADVEAEADAGWAPIDYARARGHAAVADLLEEALAARG